MKNLKRSALGLSFLIALLCLCGCEKAPEAVYRTSNPEVRVERLFTEDGCTVYRFEDSGRNHYFAKCEAGKKVTTISQHGESCGKNCHRTVDENIETTEQ